MMSDPKEIGSFELQTEAREGIRSHLEMHWSLVKKVHCLKCIMQWEYRYVLGTAEMLQWRI